MNEVHFERFYIKGKKEQNVFSGGYSGFKYHHGLKSTHQVVFCWKLIFINEARLIRI